MIRVCNNNHKTKVWEIDGKAVVTVTHPCKPNYEGHSRGRKIHLAKDDKLSKCNMLIDAYLPDNDRNWSMVTNGSCKVCFKDVKEFVLVFPEDKD